MSRKDDHVGHYMKEAGYAFGKPPLKPPGKPPDVRDACALEPKSSEVAPQQPDRKLVVDEEMSINVDEFRIDEPHIDEPRIVLTLPQGHYKIDPDGYITARLLVSQEKRR